jgi:hypothetical protein
LDAHNINIKLKGCKIKNKSNQNKLKCKYQLKKLKNSKNYKLKKIKNKMR